MIRFGSDVALRTAPAGWGSPATCPPTASRGSSWSPPTPTPAWSHRSVRRWASTNGVNAFGRLDVVSANAVCSYGADEVLPDQTGQHIMDVNFTGAWHTAKATIPHLFNASGGSTVATGSAMADLLSASRSQPTVAGTAFGQRRMGAAPGCSWRRSYSGSASCERERVWERDG